jgi:hypothetical protein
MFTEFLHARTSWWGQRNEPTSRSSGLAPTAHRPDRFSISLANSSVPQGKRSELPALESRHDQQQSANLVDRHPLRRVGKAAGEPGAEGGDVRPADIVPDLAEPLPGVLDVAGELLDGFRGERQAGQGRGYDQDAEARGLLEFIEEAMDVLGPYRRQRAGADRDALPCED